jgi:3-oxo-5-alpha-steroid 4-dehydrogenase 1
MILHTLYAIQTPVLATVMAAAGAAAFAALLQTDAPYGRYAPTTSTNSSSKRTTRASSKASSSSSSQSSWGPLIPARLAWAAQELPALLVPLCMLARAPHATRARLVSGTAAPAASIPFALFCWHYAYRSLVYPWRIRGGAPTPAGVMLMALAFCAFNGYLQARYLLYEHPAMAIGLGGDGGGLDSSSSGSGGGVSSSNAAAPQWQWPPPYVLVGAAVWALGWAVNLHSDGILRSLRPASGAGSDSSGSSSSGQRRQKAAAAQTRYRIPRGGAFELVSAANYAGEVLEWIGYAIATRGAPVAAAFAWFTFANLAPRALRHHRFYLETFPDYPKSRRAIIPYLL